MLKLEINNSYSQLIGFDADLYRKLRKELSYDPAPDAARYGGYRSSLKYLIDAKGTFPTGLLTRVRKLLLANNAVPTLVDLRKRPNSLATTFNTGIGVTPYPDQLKAATEAIKHSRAGIQMPTGSGKSVVIALLVSRLQLRTLIVVPTLELKKQLTADLDARLKRRSYPIVVENIDSPALKALKNFDVLIIDEAHHGAAKTYQDLNKTTWGGIYYRFFLSGTFFRNQAHETLPFEALTGDLVFELSHKDAVSRGYIVPTEAYVIDLPKSPTEGFTWAEVYKELVTRNTHRNNVIADLLTNLSRNQAATLCLVKEVAHGQALADLTGYPFVHGQDEDSRRYIEQFNQGKIKVLIGTEGILGEGVDTKPCEYVVIAGLGKAKSAFLQKIGRGVRRYPGKETSKVILFRDTSHKFTLQHYNAQAKILKEELGIIPVKLEIE